MGNGPMGNVKYSLKSCSTNPSLIRRLVAEITILMGCIENISELFLCLKELATLRRCIHSIHV